MEQARKIVTLLGFSNNNDTMATLLHRQHGQGEKGEEEMTTTN